MDHKELKSAFAAALLRDSDPFKAAFAVMPDPKDTALALQAATLWPKDSFVIDEQLRLIKDNGKKSFLPTKEDQALAVWRIAEDADLEPESRLKAHRLYAEIQGNIEQVKAAPTTQILNQGVMIVRDHGADDDWERSAIAQQGKLIEGHATAN